MENDRVQDEREDLYYKVHNVLIDRYLPEIGIMGLAIYNYLCRRAGRRLDCFPSVQTACKDLGVSEPTWRKYLKKLTDANLVAVEARHDPRGDHTSNLYRILKPKGVGNVVTHLGNDFRGGGKGDYPRVGNDVSPKKTHIEEEESRKDTSYPAPVAPQPVAGDTAGQPEPYRSTWASPEDGPAEKNPLDLFGEPIQEELPKTGRQPKGSPTPTTTSENETAKDLARAAGGNRAPRGKAPKPDAVLTNELKAAFLTALGPDYEAQLESTDWGREWGAAKTLTGRGYPPEVVAAFWHEHKRQPRWRSQKLSLTFVQANIKAWMASKGGRQQQTVTPESFTQYDPSKHQPTEYDLYLQSLPEEVTRKWFEDLQPRKETR